MILLLTTASDLFWTNAPSIIASLASGSIVIYFLRKKINALNTHVTALKGQVESQQGILNTTKTYFDLFDINKIKEYTSLSEDAVRLEAQKRHQAEIDLLNKQDEKRKSELDNALQEANDSSQKIELLQFALEEQKVLTDNARNQVTQIQDQLTNTQNTLISLTNSHNKPLINEGIKQENRSDKLAKKAKFQAVLNRVPPLPDDFPREILTVNLVYELVRQYPLSKENRYDVMQIVGERIHDMYPELMEFTSNPVMASFILNVIAGLLGEQMTHY